MTALLAVGLVGPPPAGGAGRGLEWFHRQQVAWTSCQRGEDDEQGKALDRAGARCAEIAVPLDYRNPSGATITVAFSRLAATDTANRIGVLLVNGGGPGGPALDMPLRVSAAMGAVAARYDIIGMDPRGIGRSTPVECHWPTGFFARSAGRDRADFDRMVAFQADLADRCARAAGSVLPYLTTRNTARDMDVVRGVLGERTISYLGYSYGTYLGAVYTALFPRHTDRVVLDGPVNPTTWSPGAQAATGPANEAALREWADWTAARHETYGLGRTGDAVMGTIWTILRAAQQRPLPIGDYLVDQHLVPVLLYSPLADGRGPSNATLADNVRVLEAAARGAHPQPTPGLADSLRFITTSAGSWYGSAQAAIICDDAQAPRDPNHYWRQIQQSRPTQPIFGPMVNNIRPCAFWPNQPIEPAIRQPGNVPAMIVAATGDPRTIYPNALALHDLMPHSRLVTLRDARIHGVYGQYGNTCVNHTVNTYLTTGHLPPADLTCTQKTAT